MIYNSAFQKQFLLFNDNNSYLNPNHVFIKYKYTSSLSLPSSFDTNSSSNKASCSFNLTTRFKSRLHNKLQATSQNDNEAISLNKSQNDGIELPIKMNNIPHSREIRQFFFEDVCQSLHKAIENKETRLVINLTIPETNPEMDVYRIGTILELVRAIAMSLVKDGKMAKISVQQNIGDGFFQGTPLSLAGVRKIMDMMDWGNAENFIKFGQIGSDQIENDCSFYIIIAPQNIVGGSIIAKLEEMVLKAEEEEEKGKVVMLLNPLLKDVPSSGGVMGIRGRKERMEFVSSFVTGYHFRLLYQVGSYFPIKGAMRHVYGSNWEVYKRVKEGKVGEKYQLISVFENQPDGMELNNCFVQIKDKDKKKSSWW